jgi:hypothetical protein
VTIEDETRRLIASSERLHETAQGLIQWAQQWPSGALPAPIQAMIDAAVDYEAQIEDYEREQLAHHQREEEDTSPKALDTQGES